MCTRLHGQCLEAPGFTAEAKKLNASSTWRCGVLGFKFVTVLVRTCRLLSGCDSETSFSGCSRHGLKGGIPRLLPVDLGDALL